MRYLKGMQHDRGLEGWKCARKRQYDPLLTSRIPPQSKRCQKRKCKHSSEKENTPAWQSQQSGTEFLSQVTDEDREVLRVLKEDESHRSFEMMTERRLKEVVDKTLLLLKSEVRSFESRKVLKVLKEDLSRRRSFERRPEERIEEAFKETRLLREQVQSFVKQNKS